MRIAPYYARRLILLTALLLVVFCGVQLFRSDVGYGDGDDSNSEKLMRISQLIKSSNDEARYTAEGVPACKLPELDINNPEILKFIHEVPALQCGPEDWVRAEGSKLFIDRKARARHGPITCAFSEVLRVDDFSTRLAEAVESDSHYVLRHSDYAEVRCESSSGQQWHSVLASVRDDPELHRDSSWAAVPRGALPLNVLMIGFDSLSRNTFARKLPKSYRLLRQSLGGLVLEGYNIVGDGTPQALIPILTGAIELELPDARRRMGDRASHVDVYPLVWKDFKAAHYVTGFMEDVPHIGTFTYRLKGFLRQPTDHYMRTYYLAAAPYFRYSKPFCLQGTPRHRIMLDHIKALFDKYRDKPKFVFGFHGELSHDSYNDIGLADEDLARWMRDLKDGGHLNDTLLIVMSDHGHRFADIRNTLQGKQEERLPFFSFAFPPWFKQRYPQAYANFLFNTRLLTTPFDVHATLKHMLKFEPPKDGDLGNRAISLFDKIPIERTCADAFIEPHWCACLSWQEISTEQEIVQRAAKYFVGFLNSYTEEHRDLCEELAVGEIMWAAKLIPTKGLLHFEKSRDTDGFVAELSAKTHITTELYQLKIKTVPGNGLFEASISYDVEKEVFSTKISDVSRINMYGTQARCVEHHLFHLRKYCYCRD